MTQPHDYGDFVPVASIIISDPLGVNARRFPNVNAEKVKLLKGGEVVGYYQNPTEGGQYNGGSTWYKIKLDGKDAFVAAGYVDGFSVIEPPEPEIPPAIYAPITSDELQQLIDLHEAVANVYREVIARLSK